MLPGALLPITTPAKVTIPATKTLEPSVHFLTLCNCKASEDTLWCPVSFAINTVLVRFNHVLAVGSFSLLYYANTPVFTRSTADAHLGNFQFGAIIKMLLWALWFMSFGEDVYDILQISIHPGPWELDMFSCGSCCQMVLQCVWTEPNMEKLYTISKNKTRSWLWPRSSTPYCQIQT